jgi:hypothetical protein
LHGRVFEDILKCLPRLEMTNSIPGRESKMKALRHLALTRSDFQGGPFFWALLCGSIVIAARVAAGSSVRVAAFWALGATFVGLLEGAIVAAFLKREREWIAIIVIQMSAPWTARPDDGVGLQFWKSLFCYLAFLWLALLIRRQFADGKGRPAGNVSPLWDAELDR